MAGAFDSFISAYDATDRWQSNAQTRRDNEYAHDRKVKGDNYSDETQRVGDSYDALQSILMDADGRQIPLDKALADTKKNEQITLFSKQDPVFKKLLQGNTGKDVSLTGKAVPTGSGSVAVEVEHRDEAGNVVAKGPITNDRSSNKDAVVTKFTTDTFLSAYKQLSAQHHARNPEALKAEKSRRAGLADERDNAITLGQLADNSYAPAGGGQAGGVGIAAAATSQQSAGGQQNPAPAPVPAAPESLATTTETTAPEQMSEKKRQYYALMKLHEQQSAAMEHDPHGSGKDRYSSLGNHNEIRGKMDSLLADIEATEDPRFGAQLSAESAQRFGKSVKKSLSDGFQPTETSLKVGKAIADYGPGAAMQAVDDHVVTPVISFFKEVFGSENPTSEEKAKEPVARNMATGIKREATAMQKEGPKATEKLDARAYKTVAGIKEGLTRGKRNKPSQKEIKAMSRLVARGKVDFKTAADWATGKLDGGKIKTQVSGNTVVQSNDQGDISMTHFEDAESKAKQSASTQKAQKGELELAIKREKLFDTYADRLFEDKDKKALGPARAEMSISMSALNLGIDSNVVPMAMERYAKDLRAYEADQDGWWSDGLPPPSMTSAVISLSLNKSAQELQQQYYAPIRRALSDGKPLPTTVETNLVSAFAGAEKNGVPRELVEQLLIEDMQRGKGVSQTDPKKFVQLITKAYQEGRLK